LHLSNLLFPRHNARYARHAGVTAYLMLAHHKACLKRRKAFDSKNFIAIFAPYLTQASITLA